MRSKSELLKLILHANIPDIPRDELEKYIDAHFNRLQFALELVERYTSNTPESHILDTGAKPYVFIALLIYSLRCKITGLGYTIEPLPKKITSYVETRLGQSELLYIDEHPFEMCQANVEMDAFPFKPNTFDTVVCTETMEHLTFNPSHLIAQINTVTKTGGHVIFSVPNALYWPRLIAFLFGKNIDDPYSHHGPYGRHNRLFTLKELRHLFKAHGFHIVHTYQKTFYPLSYSGMKKICGQIGDFFFSWTHKRGRTNILVLKKVKDIDVPIYPDFLYH